MGRILAFDFGLKRTGVAVTDVMGMIANPLPTVPTQEVNQFLTHYLKNEQVERFVVGEPRRMSGEETHASKPVQDFVSNLNKNFPSIPVTMVDERFTSVIASRAIAGSGLSKSKRRSKDTVDQVSAVLILQSYLEQQEFIRNRETR